MINWHLFSKAITEYERLGYQLVEVPWLVDSKTINITLPSGKKPFSVDGCGEVNQLVGSAEQSFIYSFLQKKLKPGKYMALTPCFRDDEVDDLHHKYFMKLELIYMNPPYPLDQYGWMMQDAKYVLSQFTNKKIEALDTPEGSDLTIDGIEIGSYGVRAHQNLLDWSEDVVWVYGTGLAEPRFSKVTKGE